MNFRELFSSKSAEDRLSRLVQKPTKVNWQSSGSKRESLAGPYSFVFLRFASSYKCAGKMSRHLLRLRHSPAERIVSGLPTGQRLPIIRTGKSPRHPRHRIV